MAGIISVSFETCEQVAQSPGNPDEQIVLRVYFSVEAKGQHYRGLFVDIKRPGGSDGSEAEKEPIEIGPPQGIEYMGPWNHQAFRTAVQIYYRRFVSSSGPAIRKDGAAALLVNRKAFRMPMKIAFDGSGPDVSW